MRALVLLHLVFPRWCSLPTPSGPRSRSWHAIASREPCLQDSTESVPRRACATRAEVAELRGNPGSFAARDGNNEAYISDMDSCDFGAVNHVQCSRTRRDLTVTIRSSTSRGLYGVLDVIVSVPLRVGGAAGAEDAAQEHVSATCRAVAVRTHRGASAGLLRCLVLRIWGMGRFVTTDSRARHHGFPSRGNGSC